MFLSFLLTFDNVYSFFFKDLIWRIVTLPLNLFVSLNLLEENTSYLLKIKTSLKPKNYLPLMVEIELNFTKAFKCNKHSL